MNVVKLISSVVESEMHSITVDAFRSFFKVVKGSTVPITPVDPLYPIIMPEFFSLKTIVKMVSHRMHHHRQLFQMYLS